MPQRVRVGHQMPERADQVECEIKRLRLAEARHARLDQPSMAIALARERERALVDVVARDSKPARLEELQQAARAAGGLEHLLAAVAVQAEQIEDQARLLLGARLMQQVVPGGLVVERGLNSHRRVP